MHIDVWTLALQAVNVLILVWLLKRFFWQPLSAVIERRKAAAAALIADAKGARDKAEMERTALGAQRASVAAARDDVLRAARAEAAAEREAILKEAADEAQKQLSDSDRETVRIRQQLERDATQRAASLAVDIARKLLAAMAPSVHQDGVFLDGVVARLSALPPPSRAQLESAIRSGQVAVVTAAPAGDAFAEECRKRLAPVLGDVARLSFTSDRDLLSGVALRGDTVVVENSWRNDLARIARELSDDDGQA